MKVIRRVPAHFLILLVGLTLVAAACSDTPGETGASATATPAFGPSPALGNHILALIPEHGASLSQAATRSPDPLRPQPPCFVVDFTGLAEQAQWFRATLDGAEITPSLTWVVSATPGSGTKPRACYATLGGLAPGIHTVTVTVTKPTGSPAEAIQVVSWSFTVTR